MSLPSTDPKVLAGLAGCFNSCVPTGFQNPLKTYLLTQITSLSPGPPGPPNITNGLVNWWKFDENAGTTAADSAGTATGSFVQTPLWVPGQINSALDFHTTPASHLSLAANTGVGAGAFTFSGWVNPDNISGATAIYDSDNDSSAGFWIYLRDAGGGVTLNIVGAGGDLKLITNDLLPVSVWSFLTCTWDGSSLNASTAHIYINTVEATYLTSNNGSGAHNANIAPPRNIAFGPDIAACNNIFDDLRLYNRVLNAAEILNMYQWRGKP